jgi:hypothetical protein
MPTITVANCRKCDWKRIQDWPEYDKYYYVEDIYKLGYPLRGE